MAKNSAASAAKNRGKAALAVGKPPYGGGPKGTVPVPKAPGPPAKKPPIQGTMSGFRPGGKRSVGK